MSVQVQGTANPNPITEVSEPSSPVTESVALTAGMTANNVSVGPYTNNSLVPLKITAAQISNQTNCTVSVNSVLPLTIQPGASANLIFVVTPTAAGEYGFTVGVTWSS